MYFAFSSVVLRERLRVDEMAAMGLFFAAVVVAMAGRGAPLATPRGESVEFLLRLGGERGRVGAPIRSEEPVMLMSLAVTFVVSASLGLWPSDPDVNLPIGEASGAQSVVKSASGPDGSVWFGWFDNTTGSYQARVQRVDFLGNETFAHNGLVVSAHAQSTSLNDWDLMVDSSGACVMVFNDTRAGSDRDIYAYRVSASGQFLWGADGVTISANDDFEPDPRVVQTSTGDYVVVWPRLGAAATRGLYMQRLNASGQKQLAPDGVLLTIFAGESPAFAEMTASDNGSVIVAWVKDTTTFQSPRHVHTQKFTDAGFPMWNAVSPTILSTTSVPIAHRPRVVSDGAGGAVYAWHDTRNGLFDCWVQRVDTGGLQAWAQGGVQVSVTAAQQELDPAISLDGASNEVMVVFRWTDAVQGEFNLGAQRISAGGSRLLTEAGVALSARSQDAVSAPRSFGTPDGGVMTAWTRTTFGSNHSTVFAWRVNSLGVGVWGASPVRLSPTTGARFRIAPALAANGMLRVGWEGDTRNDPSGDIFAQNISQTGTLGYCPGDGTWDRKVNFNDLNQILSNFGQTGLFLFGDTNGDGVVNFADLNLVLSNFGLVC